MNDLKQEQNDVEAVHVKFRCLKQHKSLEDYADILGTRTVRAIQHGTASSRDLQKAFERISRETVGTSADLDEVRQALQKLDSGERFNKRS